MPFDRRNYKRNSFKSEGYWSLEEAYFNLIDNIEIRLLINERIEYIEQEKLKKI